MGLDFDGVARAALARAYEFLPLWMGGKRVGTEWVGEKTSRGGIGDSWSINLTTGVWRHFAGTESGSDMISLFAALNGLEQGAAFHAVREQLGGAAYVPVLPMRSRDLEPESKAEPIPEDAPELRDHPNHGAHTAEYRYGNSFRVTRYDFLDADGRPDKVFAQWTWRRGKWANQGYGSNRPLYGLHELAKNPGAKVLVVEGEKCVDVASRVLQGAAIVTWAGGSQAWRHTDWSPLHGRDVVLWPDADEVGRQAAADIAQLLANQASSIKIVNPNGADPGWDIADAILKDGMDGTAVSEFMREHYAAPALPKTQSPEDQSPEAELVPIEATPRAPIRFETIDESRSAAVSLADLGLQSNNNKIPFPTVANASKILQLYPNFKGHIWFDDFRGAIYHTLRGSTPQRWTDAETRALTVRVQQELNLEKFTTHVVQEGLQHAAECNRRNSLTAWLDSLPAWDGVERLDVWLADCAGVEFNDYSKAVASNWLIGMVARAYKPGCKMDNMPVLEGVSGLSKTTLLETLGGEWYKPLPMEFGSKDFLQALRGSWLVEIPDMTGFNRVAHSAILATLTIRNDTYRAPYGREPQEYPRTCVFAATSETDDYLSDMRGKRRYWPVRCTDINLDTLNASREHLFAEAIFRFRRSDKWYVMPKEATEEEQNARATSDPWEDLIAPKLDARWQEFLATGHKLTTYEILTNMIYKEPGQQSDLDAKRVSRIMGALGYRHKRLSREKWWLKKHPE